MLKFNLILNLKIINLILNLKLYFKLNNIYLKYVKLLTYFKIKY